MSKRNRAAKFAATGMFLAGGAVALAANAAADPLEPAPVEPIIAEAAPGQTVVDPNVPAVAAPALPPAGQAPVVPEVQAPQSSGVLGSLGDLWRAARTGDPDELNPNAGMVVGVPEGAGPAPTLPPGFQSINAPESNNTEPVEEAVGPPLPEGYYPLDGPPPPGYTDPVPPVEQPVPAP